MKRVGRRRGLTGESRGPRDPDDCRHEDATSIAVRSKGDDRPGRGARTPTPPGSSRSREPVSLAHRARGTLAGARRSVPAEAPRRLLQGGHQAPRDLSPQGSATIAGSAAASAGRGPRRSDDEKRWRERGQEVPDPSHRGGPRDALTPEDELDCLALGRERCEVNESAGARSNNYSSRPDRDISVQGVRGEMAFCRMFGLPVEVYDTTPRRAATESRFDGVMPDGSTVDVKTVARADAPLAVCEYKRHNPPGFYALLVAHEDGRIEFRGAIDATQVLRSHNLRHMRGAGGSRGRMMYEVAQARLSSFHELSGPPADEDPPKH